MNKPSLLPKVLVACLALPGVAAAADPRDACFTAYEEGQRLRNAGRLRAAREQLVTCTDAACPAFVKKDCSAWLDEVESRIPAVVLTPRDAKGKADATLRVFVDGERIAEAIDGRAIPVDPGPHDVRCELGGRSTEQHVVVPEGDKTFPLVVDLEALAPPPVPPQPAGEASVVTPKPWIERLPPVALVLGGVSVAGLASFATFALAGQSVQQCAPACTSSQVSALRLDYAAADVSLLTAVAAAGGAAYFALSSDGGAAKGARAHARTAAWWLGARIVGPGAVVGAGAAF